MIAHTVEQALGALKLVADKYHDRTKDDFEVWVEGGKALHDLRDAHKREKGKPASKDDMRRYCEPFGIHVSTAYRWLPIAKHEPQIREKMKEAGMESADQSTMLDWIKTWKHPKKTKDGEEGETAAKPKPSCPICNRALTSKVMAAEVARKMADFAQPSIEQGEPAQVLPLPSSNGAGGTTEPKTEKQPPPKEPESLLKTLAQMEYLSEHLHADCDKIDWSKEDAAACRDKIWDIIQSLDVFVGEVDEHVSRKAS